MKALECSALQQGWSTAVSQRFVTSHGPVERTHRACLLPPSTTSSGLSTSFSSSHASSSILSFTSQHGACSSFKTKGAPVLPRLREFSKVSSFEALATALSETNRGGCQRKQTAILAAQGDALGNNNIQFSHESSTQDSSLQKNHVPLYVMLPLDTVTMLNKLRRVKALQAGFRALKLIGVDGVMVHVWWGAVEGEAPKNYNWSAYEVLLNLIKTAGLKVQASICFHGCSKPVEGCIISLPSWIVSIGNVNPDIYHMDRAGNRFKDCLSLAVDTLPLLEGRSPVQIYRDFLENFRETFSHYLGNTIVEVIMGLGPEGELRYPAYREGSGLWRFPGIGEFQCYDKYMLESLRKYAEVQGKPEWGHGGPVDAPSYNQRPNDVGFFNEQNGSWNEPSGQLFLSWYSGELLAHGDRMLSAASSVFRKDHVVIVGKVPGVHWWYKTKSHAAELTAGYYNIDGHDGYEELARMFANNSAMMILPCMEMSDREQPSEARCSPEMLLLQIRKACSRHGVPVAGQNSLPRFDDIAYTRIKNSIHRFDYPFIPRLAVFTFLRMGESLFYAEHWRLFVRFVRNMDQDAIWGDSRDGPPGGQNTTFLGSYFSNWNTALQLQY